MFLNIMNIVPEISVLFLFFLVHHAKLKNFHIRTFYIYGTSAKLLEIFLFWFRAVSKLYLARYGSKHASLSLSNMPFCAYLKYNSKTTVCLQLCHTPNKSSAIEDALFHVEVAKQLNEPYKLWSHTNTVTLLFVPI